jgi:hypothetical protein
MRGLLTGLLLCAWTVPGSAQEGGLEYRVKAAYLFNFTKFVEWPDTAVQKTTAFTICTAAINPFGTVLASTLAEETAAMLPLASRVVGVGEAASCQVLFVPRGVAAAPFLRAVASSPVLTVGESATFLEQGGAINFVIEGGRVRFVINQTAAERVRLRISSRLLQLGRGADDSQGDD